MPSRLSSASRGAVLAGIIVLHLAAVAVALTMKGPLAVAQPQAAAFQVLLLREPEHSRPPDFPVTRTQNVVPQVVVPIVNIELHAPASTISVTAVAAPAPAVVPAPAIAAAPASGPVSDGDPDAPVAVAEADWMRMPSPAYPAAARKARAQGVVLVRVLVDTTGHALKVVVHRSSGFAVLDRAACDSVLAALFRPYLHNGVPRSVEVIVPITFELIASRKG